MAYLSIILLIAGLLMYLRCSQSKAQEIGRMIFFAALLALCIVVFAPLSARLFHG